MKNGPYLEKEKRNNMGKHLDRKIKAQRIFITSKV